MLGYLVFVELARLLLAPDSSATSTLSTALMGTPQHTAAEQQRQLNAKAKRLASQQPLKLAGSGGAAVATEAVPVTQADSAKIKATGLRGSVLRLEKAQNFGLALASAAMFCGIVRACFVSGKLQGGVHALLCAPFAESTLFVATARAFYWSKYWEWADTALLVAKGKPVSW